MNSLIILPSFDHIIKNIIGKFLNTVLNAQVHNTDFSCVHQKISRKKIVFGFFKDICGIFIQISFQIFFPFLLRMYTKKSKFQGAACTTHIMGLKYKFLLCRISFQKNISIFFINLNWDFYQGGRSLLRGVFSLQLLIPPEPKRLSTGTDLYLGPIKLVCSLHSLVSFINLYII